MLVIRLINTCHRIVNKNYGLAAGILSTGKEDETGCSPFQVLFDTCDLFVDEQPCDDLGKTLADVVSVGDFIRLVDQPCKVCTDSILPDFTVYELRLKVYSPLEICGTSSFT